MYIVLLLGCDARSIAIHKTRKAYKKAAGKGARG
jgi:hypothetical protein